MTWYDDAMRTIIDVPAQQLDALDDVCRRDGISRAEAIRRAVALLLQQRGGAPEQAFGLWRGRKVDGLAYERALRDEWHDAAGHARPARRRR